MRAFLTVLLLLLFPAPAAVAQTVVIQGRVEDAASRTPLVDVEVFAADSSAVAVTDVDGIFVLEVPLADPITVWARRLGYRTFWFELPESAPSRLAVLRLEPAPIELEGIHVVGESALEKVVRDLKRRRNAYAGPVSAYDRALLERLAPFGTAWDFVRRRAVQVFECASSWSGLCSRARGRTSIALEPREFPVLVCIDGRESWGAVDELGSLDIESVALVEIFSFGRGGIRVYTPGYIASNARRGRNIAVPLAFGC